MSANKDIIFRYIFTIRDLLIHADSPLEFNCGNEKKINITLCRPNKTEQTNGHLSTNAFCTAITSSQPTDKNLYILDQIEKNRILKESDELRMSYTSEDGNKISLPDFENFPEHFKHWISQISNELTDSIKRLVSILRWRCNHKGRHDPYASCGFYWSREGEFWHPLTQSGVIIVDGVNRSLRISSEVKDEIYGLIEQNEDEPIYHQLYREAYSQIISNTRSALVLGIAAAEIAVKQCITQLAPQTEWLINNLQSPPIVKLLRDYIPSLQTKCPLLVVPQKFLKSLEIGVKKRNDLVHGGIADIKYDEKIEEIILTIRDLLWLSDYYKGKPWALNYIRRETLVDLGLSDDDLKNMKISPCSSARFLKI